MQKRGGTQEQIAKHGHTGVNKAFLPVGTKQEQLPNCRNIVPTCTPLGERPVLLNQAEKCLLFLCSSLSRI